MWSVTVREKEEAKEQATANSGEGRLERPDQTRGHKVRLILETGWMCDCSDEREGESEKDHRNVMLLSCS